MLVILGCFLLAAGLYVLYSIENQWYRGVVEVIGGAVSTFLVTLVLSALVFLLVSSVVSETTTIDDYVFELEETTEISALKDSQDAEGHFYLLGGYTGEELYYYYAKDTEMGVFVDKIRADDCLIRFTDGQPRIEKYSCTFKDRRKNLYAMPMYGLDTVVYIPEGSMTTEFAVYQE